MAKHAHNHIDKPNKAKLLVDITTYSHELQKNGRLTPVVQEALEKAKGIRSNYHTVFYIAGGLTGVSDEIKERYAQLSTFVAGYDGVFGYAPHLHGTDPVVHPDVTPEEVRDIDYLFSAIVPDYHINCLYPLAHGNAIETAWAEMKGIPTIYLVPKGVTLSRLVRGMHNIEHTIIYSDFEESLRQLQRLPILIEHDGRADL